MFTYQEIANQYKEKEERSKEEFQAIINTLDTNIQSGIKKTIKEGKIFYNTDDPDISGYYVVKFNIPNTVDIASESGSPLTKNIHDIHFTYYNETICIPKNVYVQYSVMSGTTFGVNVYFFPDAKSRLEFVDTFTSAVRNRCG